LGKEFSNFATFFIRHGFESFSNFHICGFVGRSRGGSHHYFRCFSDTGTCDAGSVSLLFHRALSGEVTLFFAIEVTPFVYETFTVRVRGMIALGSSDVYIHSIGVALWSWNWAQWLLLRMAFVVLMNYQVIG
jgi:hypothetical protein